MNATAQTDTGMPAILAPVSFARPAVFGAPVSGAALTDVGLVRARNEDDYLLKPEAGFFAVADGMGGHAAGHVASALCVETLSDVISAREVGGEAPVAALPKAIRAANARIRNAAAADIMLTGMGTTVAALWLQDDRVLIAHVGDSRIYRLRAGRLARLTLDHSLVGAAVRRGAMSQIEADALGPCHVLTQALGTRARVEVEQMEIGVMPGDQFLLCSDGISDLVSDREIEAIMDRYDTPAGAVRALAVEALRAGGRDNLTAVIVQAR